MKKQNENTTQNTPSTGGDGESVPGTPGSAATAPGTDTDTLMRLQTENEQLKTSIRQTEAHRQITGELVKAGARSPELLFDSVKSDLQFAEDGKVENAAALIGKLKVSFPEQFGFERPASIDAGAGIAVTPQLSKDALAKMKPAEIAELDWADVRRVLSA